MHMSDFTLNAKQKDYWSQKKLLVFTKKTKMHSSRMRNARFEIFGGGRYVGGG